MPKVAFWQGNAAIAMGALAAGCRFFGLSHHPLV